MKNDAMKYVWRFVVAIGLFMLSACGGGGGGVTGTTLSGTAAAGAPVIGTITVQDSSTPAKTKQVTILSNGKYTVDVADMTGPFMLRADGAVGGTEIHIYSAATKADVGGTINVTPFTDLIVANIAGSLAKTFYDNQGFNSLTANDLKTNADELKAKILPVLQALGIDSSVDLLRVSFSADNTGLDRVMDVIKVTTNPATEVATIKNIITGQQITDDLKTKNEIGKLDDVANLSDLAQIDNQLKIFSALFASSVPLPTNPQLLALFDQQSFVNSGKELNAFLSDITSDSKIVGLIFTNLEVKSLQNNIAHIAFNALDKNGKNLIDSGQKMLWQATKINNVWLLQGDQKIGSVDVNTLAIYYPTSPPANSIETGLYLDVSDNGNNRFDTATVTGPGINGAITLNKSITADNFRLSGYAPIVSMSETQIGSIPDSGASYVFKLYSSGVLKATYTATLGKRPYKPSELSASMFPAVSAATDTAFSTFNGGSLTVSWTMPAGLKPGSLTVELGDSNSVHVNSVSYDLDATATSHIASLEAKTASGQSFTPTWRDIHLSGKDIYGRDLSLALFR